MRKRVTVFRLTLEVIKRIKAFAENEPARYGVCFDNRWGGVEFRYSWEVAISKN
jgi:hypothetical protein